MPTQPINKGIEALKALTSTEKGLIPLIPKVDRRKFNKRDPKSGKKPSAEIAAKRGIKEIMEGHFASSVKIEVRDPKTGKTYIIDKPRALVLLEDLFATAHNTKEVAAIKEWYDRAVGKAPQVISSGPTPFRMDIRVMHLIAEKVYGGDNTGKSE